jgi:cytochrome P450
VTLIYSPAQIDKLVRATISSTGPTNMYMAFRSTTLDVISSYCFSESFGALSFSSFDHPFLVGMESAIKVVWTLSFFPFLHYVLPHMPDFLTVSLNPGAKAFLDIRKQTSTQIDKILADPGLLDLGDREIIYHHLLTPQHAKGQIKILSKKSLLEEALSMLFAGSDTVGNACTVGAFNILNDERVRGILLRELDAAWPDKDTRMGYEALEKLPYLVSFISNP